MVAKNVMSEMVMGSIFTELIPCPSEKVWIYLIKGTKIKFSSLIIVAELSD